MAAPPAVLSGPVTPALVWELVLRDLRLRYRRSALGVLWSQLPAVAYVAVLTVVFTRIVPLDIEDYPVFVLLGMLPWLWFQAALTSATASVVSAPDLLRHPGFPRECLPVAAVAASLANHLLALPVAAGAVLVATGQLPPTSVAVVGLVGVQSLLCLGPAFALAALHVRLRDTAHLVGVVLLPLFYATPVFYDVGSLDALPVLRLNPMAPIIDGYRDALLAGSWPSPLPLLAVAAAGAVGTLAGRAFYRARMSHFVDVL